MNPFTHHDGRQLLDAFDSMKNELNQLSSNLNNISSYVETEDHDFGLRISGEFVVSELQITDNLFLMGKESFIEKLVKLLNQAIQAMGQRVKQEIAGISTESYMTTLQSDKQDNYSDMLQKYQKECGEINSKMENEIYSFSSPSIATKCLITGSLIIKGIDINERNFNLDNKTNLEREIPELINKALMEIRTKASKELIDCQRRAFKRQ